VLKLKLPPLRDRFDDIPLILDEILRKRGRIEKRFTADMIAALRRYDWPGNIRELAAFIQGYLVLLGDEPCNTRLFHALLLENMEETTIENANSPIDLPLTGPLRVEEAAGGDLDALSGEGNLRERMDRVERRLIENSLKACRYNKKDTAKQLGVSVHTLWRKMQRHALS
jgi:DNA-binding NtrC family response regulator